MKIKTVNKTYDEVLATEKARRFDPKRPSLFFRTLVRLAASGDLKKARFSYTSDLPEGLLDKPCLILMNHSAFIDLEIVSKIMYPRPYTIVCTSDGFVGKKWLMRQIGCFPTKKFVSDPTLIKDIKYSLNDLKTSVLMYPEASYSFDGKATPLKKRMGVLFRMLGVPVIFIRTYGAFSRDPLYNCLQVRDVTVTAHVSCLFDENEVKELSLREIDERLERAFSFDNFKWQHDNGIKINESFRADGLDRIIYKCPACSAEGQTEGRGTKLTCRSCGAEYELDPLGRLVKGDTVLHIPDLYDEERASVRREIENGSYLLDTEVTVGIMKDYKAIYMVGEGRLIHNSEGFTLTVCEGKLEYRQSPLACYSLYSDYYWYEIDDVICIGDNDVLYYCFPKTKNKVAKTRLAVEELYKIKKAERPKNISSNIT